MKQPIPCLNKPGIAQAEPIRILLLDAHVVCRAGLRLLIESRPGMKIVGEAGTCEDAMVLLGRERLDIILMGLDFEDEKSMGFIPQMLDAGGEARILVLTSTRSDAGDRSAVQLGASGVIHKQCGPDIVIEAITKVHRGELWVQRPVMARMLAELLRPKPAKVDPEALKDRNAYATGAGSTECGRRRPEESGNWGAAVHKRSHSTTPSLVHLQ